MMIRDNASAQWATPNTNKWNSFEGHRAMQDVHRIGMHEVEALLEHISYEASRSRIRGDMNSYWEFLEGIPYAGYGVDPEEPRAARYVRWARRNIAGSPPFLSRTFGQIFESKLEQLGLKPFQYTPKYTYWTGNWSHVDDLIEGFTIRTSIDGFSIVYRENRRYGLSWGPHRSDLKSFGGKGWLTRKVMFSGAFTNTFKVYSHMSRDNGRGYSYIPSQESYQIAVELIALAAHNIAAFMNDRDFHILEHIKREIRRSHGNEWMSRNEPLDAQQIELVGEAYVLTEQLHLLVLAESLYRVWQSGYWNGNPGPDERGVDPVPALMIGSWPPEPRPLIDFEIH